MTWKATHGHTRGLTAEGHRVTSREYNTWLAMRQRCNDPNHAKYKSYGARGIKVCPTWQDSFEAFLVDMGPRPEGKTLDRRDNNKDYNPDNCRWATPKEQMENRTKESFDSRSKNTHCPSGHPYSGDNLYVRKNETTRRCRTCLKEQAQRNKNIRKAFL